MSILWGIRIAECEHNIPTMHCYQEKQMLVFSALLVTKGVCKRVSEPGSTPIQIKKIDHSHEKGTAEVVKSTNTYVSSIVTSAVRSTTATLVRLSHGSLREQWQCICMAKPIPFVLQFLCATWRKFATVAPRLIKTTFYAARQTNLIVPDNIPL